MSTSKPTSFTEIPVIDVSQLYSDSIDARKGVAELIRQAAQDVGFFYIKGHPISKARIEGLVNATKAFFAQDVAVKMQSYIGHSTNHSGYVPEGEEVFGSDGAATHIDHKESYDIGYELSDLTLARPMLGQNQWPPLPGFKSAVLAYYEEAFALGCRLFGAFALALDLPENYFDENLTAPPSQLRMVHYPYDAQATDREGIGAHTDYECFTLLLPTCDGLEVMNGEGKWIDAPFRPDCLVVNIGDMLELMSGGRFIATAHRVRKVKQERYSFPLFCSLDYDTTVAALTPEAEHAQSLSLRCGDHLYAQTIQTFTYLKKQLRQGLISMPEHSQQTGTFGQINATSAKGRV